ncbi:LOW QUALITY PROTEIN: DNA polymerase alpha catalytic subunit [Phalaenopsis equestris]|uniref:LOW QUALITY PROTEIN: DNA polymerase alpha catalytic subunit n=1 Tax=Phalaenopsis equestris TaxID=78828 RepID=UPI0009E274EF|nr:LOW QUALITY PROTEIN: DNA polymerase alpha catalytic subunit [Phalaenopsis equestris]
MPESSVHGRRSRAKGQDVAVRAEALERLKTLRRSGGRRSAAGVGFQIKMEEPIYDTVEEDDYDALVARRREDVGGFIVDDDGLGYADDGHEVDWSNPSLAYSSDEESLEGQEEKQIKKKAAKKKENAVKKAPPSSLSAAASLMGKQRLSSMFTSSVFKKNDRAKGPPVSSDSLIDDLIAEFAPDETDREKRRRGSATGPRSSALPSIVPIKSEMSLILVPESASNAEFMAQVQDNDNEDYGQDATIDEKDACIQFVVEEGETAKLVAGKASISEDVEAEARSNDKGFSLNAKIKKEDEKIVASATAGWKAVCSEEGCGVGIKVESNGNVDEKSEFELDSDGSLPFYIIDAHEESYGANMGNLYLFGKVKAAGTYHSCCVVVKNMQRCLYVIPRSSVFPNDKVADIERNFPDSPSASRGALQEMASELKNEITERLLDLNVSAISMLPVKRGYAFERGDIPRGQYYVVKVRYPFKDPPLPADLKGENFIALLGTQCSALELFLIKRKIKGPSWLSISRFVSSTASEKVSWCKFEVVVNCSKDIAGCSSNNFMEIPPVIVAAINLKTIITEKNANEIVSAAVVCCHKAKVDGPMMASEWKRKGMLSHFSIIRKLDGDIFPIGLQKEVADRNSKAGTNILALESSERALLNRLMIELHKLDCDVLVGHNISGFDLDVLLHRAQACKVPSSMWSKLGRLKRSMMPKLTKGSVLYGSGASSGIMSCVAGRLLCDTYLSSRDLLKEVSYSLTQLAKTQLNKDRKEINPHDIPVMFQTSAALLQLVEYGETDAWLSLELMFYLSVLPLTRQLTNISGNLWGKTLQGARAQRVEYLLLHAFHAKKYMVPDKFSARRIESTTNKRKITAGLDGEDADDLNYAALDIESHVHGKGRKSPAYSGGLVLEPKKGLYDKYILLLDFNSLYPSIIQEYNICFTTVERPSDDIVPNLPSSKNAGILPELLRNLVERRRTVKKLLKNASGVKVQQLDIQQQALKLTANSMYGCLGFSNSRFYAKPIAELITSQGREILQSTVDLVQNNLNLEVVYGDTDSIMIYSGLDDISKAKAIAAKVIQEVNKKYRCLEIDLDGLYKRMLLLKKKKYAAVKVQFKDGIAYEAIERKGLDMVRRDWSLLSKEIGDFCLNQILSGGTCDDVVESIHGYLMKVQGEIRKGEVALEKFVITKSLTKPPEDYPDAKNQPHVQVALRLKKNGYSSCSAGDTIPYVICCQQDVSSGSSSGIAQRARHPEELTRDNGEWMIDIDYYLSQQIHPVVSRLCASIQGTSPARLADCLGLDSSKFQHKSSDVGSKDSSNEILSVINDDERYHGCKPLRLSCPSCSSSFDCPPVSSFFSSRSNESTSDSQAELKSDVNFWHRMRCSRCPDDVDGCKITPAMIANQVKRQADYFISLYYKGLMTCDDEMCKYTTRGLNLRVIGESERGTVCPNYPRCNGRLVRQYNEADLYRQLSYFCYVLDVARCIEKLDKKFIAEFEKDFPVIVHSAVDLGLPVIQKTRDRCAYGWVHLKDLIVSV